MTSNGDQLPLPIPPQKRFAKFTFKKKGTADHQNSVAVQKSPTEQVPDIATSPTATNYKPAPTIPEQPLAEEGTSWDR